MVTNHHVRIGHGNLEWGDVKGCHVIFAASFILVIDDIFPNIVVGVRVFDLSFSTTIVHNEHKD